MNYFFISVILLFIPVVIIIFGIKSKFFIFENKISSVKQFIIYFLSIFIFLFFMVLFIQFTISTFDLTGSFYESINQSLNSILFFIATIFIFVQMLKYLVGSGQFDELNHLLNPLKLFAPLHLLSNNLILIQLLHVNERHKLDDDLKQIGLLKTKINNMNKYDLYALSTYLKVSLTKEKLFFNGFTLAFISLVGGYLLNKTDFIKSQFGDRFFWVVVLLTSIFLFCASIVNKNLFLLSIVTEDVIREKE